MLSLEEAQTKILAAMAELGSESIHINRASGRFLSGNIQPSVDLPPFDNSAMDGYAVRADDLARAGKENPVALSMIGKVAAGESFTQEIQRGQCVRLFTGSALPKGADAVVMQEDVATDPSDATRVLFHEPAKPWENIRLRGEDIRSGTLIAKAGDRLTPMLASLLAAGGIGKVAVGRRPIVGILATGSE